MPRRPRPALSALTARAALVALVALVAACSDDGPEPVGTATSTTAAPSTELPEVVEEFLASAAGDDARFTADYQVLRKLGSLTSQVHVEQDPPWTRIEVDDLVVVDGPRPGTCLRSAARCLGEVREQQLAGRGLFSGFATTGPREAIETIARRGDATFGTATRTTAGVALTCLQADVSGTRAAEWCLTPDGVLGYTDTVVQRVELLAYAPTASLDGELPGELVADDGFLTG